MWTGLMRPEPGVVRLPEPVEQEQEQEEVPAVQQEDKSLARAVLRLEEQVAALVNKAGSIRAGDYYEQERDARLAQVAEARALAAVVAAETKAVRERNDKFHDRAREELLKTWLSTPETLTACSSEQLSFLVKLAGVATEPAPTHGVKCCPTKTTGLAAMFE
jgi:hypothetical protein